MARKGENIHKRKDGRWEARIIEGYRPNGKSKYRSIYGKTYTEVRAKREEALAKIAFRPMPPAKKLTDFDYIASEWLRAIRSSVKESTYTRYHRTIGVYLSPAFGNRPLFKLSPEEIGSTFEHFLENGGKRGAALSPKTVNDLFSVFRQILRYARAHGYACPDTLPPEYSKRKAVKIKTLCLEEIQKLEQSLWNSDDTVSLGILFSLYTGIRIGEICGLRWEDIDFKNGTVRIFRTVERIANLNPAASSKTQVILSAPKTEHAIREIPLPRALLEHLKRQKSGEKDYLITGSDAYSEPHTLYIRYKRYLKRNGLAAHSFHTLRHTFASRCIEAGFDVKSLSEILGHSDVTTTLRYYVHPSMESKRRQMELLVPQGR